MMNICVCIKQVPATSNVRVDEETGVLLRDGTLSKMNPYDLFALETALRLRAAHGGRVVACTMGPPQAEAVLREALMMGADDGCLISDRRLGGADVLATSYTLAQAIQSMGDFDVILCGKQTTDGDTAQVGPAIAEHMSIPHAAWVSQIDAEEGGLRVRQQLQDAVETVFMPFPCLVTVEQDIHTPRLPSLLRYEAARQTDIKVLSLDAFLDADPEHYGLSGSPTQVERIFPPERTGEREMWEGEGSAEKLHALLSKLRLV